MTRSLRVCNKCIDQIQLALQRNFPSKKALAEDVGLARSTVSNFFGRIPIDHLNFEEICQRLGLDWKEVADFRVSQNSAPGEQAQARLAPVELLPLEPSTSGSPVKQFTPREELKSPGAQLPLDFVYVERPPVELHCYQEVLQPGALIRIKAPRQMGKTWLISKVLNYAANEGCRTGDLNLRLAVDTEDYTNLDQFLRFFCASISLLQGMPNRVEEHWQQKLGNSKLKCTSYFQKYLLAVDYPLVIALDELDRIYPYPTIAGHFLGMLRTWHEMAKTKVVWQKLRWIVGYRETFTQLSHHQSPFNVGTEINLSIFTKEQVCKLVQMYELTWDETQVEQLMGIVGGLPYLLHQAVSHLGTHQDITLEELLATASTSEGIYNDHLQGLMLRLQQSSLIKPLKQVMVANSPVQINFEQISKLHSMGLVLQQGDQVVPSCQLYRQYFCEHL